jgi:hypothetical protein
MPKVCNTRKQKAKELLERLERGPAFSAVFCDFNQEEAIRQFRIWSKSWIIPVVKELIRELKEEPKNE